MKPQFWGPQLWYILHIISFEYPEIPNEITKRTYHDFYASLKDVLPCSECRRHYKEYLHTFPLTPHLDSRDTLIKWVHELHNIININTGKRSISLDEMIDIYSNLNPISPFATIDNIKIAKKHEIKQYTKLYYWIVIMIIILISIKFYYNRYYFSL